MISKNISLQNILDAISEIDKNDIPPKRNKTKFRLFYNKKSYPPKYVLSLANKFANGCELKPNEFGGGNETNSFLIELGFEIKEGHKVVKKKINKTGHKIIVTAIIESNGKYNNKSRMVLLEKIIVNLENNVDLIVLPGGFLGFTKKSIKKVFINKVGNQVKELLNKNKKDFAVCFGIDAPTEIHQLGIAISREGILAFGRKFYPTKEEKKIEIADSHQQIELGLNRIFKWKGENYFLAVCYDIFGIKKLNLPVQNIDYVIDMIHGFNPKTEGNSGEVYYAKNGLAGASKQWKCPVFASVVFYNRELPPKWPSGVLWNKKSLSTKEWKYSDNPLTYSHLQIIQMETEKVILRYFDVI